MKTLGAALIVKDEELVIKRCVESIIPVCDEIVVVDTGSSDNTLNILNELQREHSKIKISHFPWVDDFSMARNYSFSLVTTDYVMWVDSDEYFTEMVSQRINDLKDNDFFEYDIVSLGILFKYGDGTVGTCERDRIVSMKTNPFWRFPVHEEFVVEGSKLCLNENDYYVVHEKEKESNARYYYEIFLNQLLHDQLAHTHHNFYYFLWTTSWYDTDLAKYFLPVFAGIPSTGNEYDYRLWFKNCGMLSSDEWLSFLITTTCNPTESNLRILLDRAVSLFQEKKWYAAFLLLIFCRDNFPKNNRPLLEKLYEHLVYTLYQLNFIDLAITENNRFYELFPDNEIAIENLKYFNTVNQLSIVGIIYFNGNQWRLPNLIFHMRDICTNIVIASDNGMEPTILSGIEYPITCCKTNEIDEVLNELSYDGLMVIDDSREITFKEKCNLVKSHKYGGFFIEFKTDNYKMIKQLNDE